MKKLLLLSVAVMCSPCLICAQNSFRDRFESFDSQAREEYESFRDRCNREYAEFLLKQWETFEGQAPVELPDEKMDPPLPFSIDEEEGSSSEPAPILAVETQTPEEETALNLQIFNELWGKASKKLKEWRVTAVKKMYSVAAIIHGPSPEPAPKPVEPIVEKPVLNTAYYDFVYCGTNFRVRAGDDLKYSLQSIGNRQLASAWSGFKGTAYDNLLYDFLQIRTDRLLCDWAYIQLLYTFTTKFYGESSEATLMTLYLMSQSGYKVRLGRSGNNLYLLYACYNEIYGKPQYWLDKECPFFVLNGEPQILVGDCAKFPFPNERPVSLNLVQEPTLDGAGVSERVLVSKRSSMTVTCGINLNLMEFFDSYPSSRYDGNDLTRWAIYANTPLDNTVKGKLYPELKARINGKTELESVDILLDFVQEVFPYGVDDEIWGCDRAFFAEETLHYPKSDCEDHAILFSRLVRDLVGLDVVLVYYPKGQSLAHLATAVKFNESINGDCFHTESGDFFVCDPTCPYAPVGCTAPNMDNSKAQIIALAR